ncbi:E3 SUMO-protein ligase ZBED1 [Frankliniella fusca]|uniref:E3 SUMO-protein ligase ZBED1 n=1 Tax=Frankliniella fusca TaxID=407009 RepID=A0AAE1HAD6_9NEOP|nr:E3 SUMO-protein ligase ZBED1 [Frankliniella fusca]
MKSRGGRSKPSAVWQHFKKSGKDVAKCNYCQGSKALVSHKHSNTTNLRNHLKNHHFPIFLKLGQETGGGGDEDSDNEQEIDEENLLLDVEVRSPDTGGAGPSSSSASTSRLSPSESPSRSSVTSESESAANASAPFSPPISPAPKRPSSRSGTPLLQGQEKMDTYCVPDSKTTERLHYAVTYYIVTCNRPLNTVEKPGFKEMLKAFKPGYTVLSRRFLTDDYIPRLEEQVKSHLKSLLENAGECSLTSDNWTSQADIPYASLTSHFFDKGWENLYAVTLSCRAMHGSHTGENLKAFFEEALGSWGIDIKNCVSLTTDNASDMRLAAELLDIPHMRCIAHTLQNGVEEIFKDDLIKPAVKACKELLAWQHKQKVWKEYKAYVKKHHSGCKAKKLPTISPTRWWSELNLFESVVESQHLLRQFAAAYSNGKFQRMVPGPKEMYIIQSVIRALKPIEQICSNLSGDTYVTASAVLPIIHLLEAGFEDDDAEIEDELDEDDEFDVDKDRLTAAALRLPILMKLHKRFSPGELDEQDLAAMTPVMAAQGRIDHRCAVKCNDLLTKVSFLDPRYKEELTASEKEKAKFQLIAEYRASLSAEGGATEEAITPVASQPSLAGLFAKRRKTGGGVGVNNGTAECSGGAAALGPEELFQQELSRFDSIQVHMETDIRLWWKERVDTYPRLAVLARKYLSMPATSTPSERLFSVGGNIITDTRTCLGGELSETLIFLSSNKSLIKKPAHR